MLRLLGHQYHRAGRSRGCACGFKSDREDFDRFVAACSFNMQAALTFWICLYRTHVARRRLRCDGPDGIHLSFWRRWKIGREDVTLAGFVPKKTAFGLRRRSGAVERQIARGGIAEEIDHRTVNRVSMVVINPCQNDSDNPGSDGAGDFWPAARLF